MNGFDLVKLCEQLQHHQETLILEAKIFKTMSIAS